MRHHLIAVAASCTFLMLAACGADKTASPSQQAGEDSLPKPGAAAGSVTGMPNPGTPAVMSAPVAQMPDLGAEHGGDDAMAVEPGPPMDPTPLASDDVDAAVLVLREYYAAINARDFGGAYALWSDGGRASGQSPQQFSDGFIDTVGVSVAFGEPDPIEGAAGSRYIKIPATLEATQNDGSVVHYTGALTLRRSMVDGSNEPLRNWHIVSATLREIRQ